MSAKNEVSPNILSSLWNFFASVKLTVVLLLCMAVLSILGTFIPQNASAEDYIRIFGIFRYQLFVILDIVDMYHSWWFVALMVLLVANIVVCSIDRLKTTWKVIFVRDPKFDLQKYRQRQDRIEFNTNANVAQLKQPFRQRIAKSFRYCKVLETETGFAVTAEKGRLSRLGVYIVHFSIVVLLLGGLIGSTFGFEGFVAIPEGETADTINLHNSSRQLRLPFQIRCNDFSVSFYEGGKRPKEFRSSLTVMENGREVLKRDILVNDPLYHQGIGVYQSSYGKMDSAVQQMPHMDKPPERIELQFQSVASGMVYTSSTTIGETVEIPEGLGRLSVERFIPDAKFMNMELGPALEVQLYGEEGEPKSITLPFHFPKFDAMRKGRVIISVVPEHRPREQERYYTGLQVVYDPGVGLVYTGFILMIVGCWVAFFMPHRQVVVDVTAMGASTRVVVAGKSNKARMGFKLELERLAAQLNSLADGA
jgi:cytochrome c biogenesis protein